MDAFIFIIIALVFVFLDMKNTEGDVECNTEVTQEDVTRVARVNDYYYDDPNAFCQIINQLGFPKERSD